MFKRKTLFLLLVFSLLISSISYGVSSTAAGKIALSKASVSLCKKESYQLTLKGAKAKKVKWQSSNKKIAAVKKGLVKAKKKGQCTITATYKGKKYMCKVQVYGKKYVLPVETSKPEVTIEPTEPPSAEETIAPSETATPTPEEIPVPDDEEAPSDVELVVENYDQDLKCVTYSIINNSDKEVITGVWVTLQKYDGEKWVYVKRKSDMVILRAMLVKPGKKEYGKAWLGDEFEGDLSSGRYRLGKQIQKDGEDIQTTSNIYAEFTIQNDVELVIDSFDQESKHINYSIVNHSSETISMGVAIALERYDGKKWVSVGYKNGIFIALAVEVEPEGIHSESAWLDEVFQNLSSGRYRLYKDVYCWENGLRTTTRLNAEFTIE